MKRTIYFASDHAGFELKNILLEYVEELGFEVKDCGAYTYDAEDDFTDFIAKAARAVSADPEHASGIILGGSGQGEAMLANRFHDVRAAVYYGGNERIVTLSREHNDANVLSLGARFLTHAQAKEAVKVWLQTPHSHTEKYERRNDKIDSLSEQMQHKPRISLVPSLPASSFEELQTLTQALKGVAKGLQLDMVDGVFAPHLSWPFTEEDPVAALSRVSELTADLEVEVDCMCIEPQTYLDALVASGVRRVVIHYGSTVDYASCFAHAKAHGYKIGLALTNDVPLAEVYPYRADIDFVQVMGIAHVGAQGQSFDVRTLDTVSKLRTLDPSLEISVDGSVNAQTIPSLLQSGVNRFAPGSAISKAPDPRAAYEHLAGMVGI